MFSKFDYACCIGLALVIAFAPADMLYRPWLYYTLKAGATATLCWACYCIGKDHRNRMDSGDQK